MKLIKRGKKLDRIWRGVCGTCGSEFEDSQENVEKEGREFDLKDHGEYAHRDCPECGAKKGFLAVVLYPKNEL